MAFKIPRELMRVFIDEGLVPPDCASLTLVIPADGAVRFVSEVHATPDHIAKLARCLALIDQALVAERTLRIVPPS